MKAFVFAGQGAQYPGMGLDLYEQSDLARHIFSQADEILGWGLSEIMFRGSADDLKATRVTQPAMFLHGYVKIALLGADFRPDAVAGHSLGEITALVAAGALSFADGLRLVAARANAIQAACDTAPGTMAAVLGLDDATIEQVCASQPDTVVAANYNCPGQLVISGTHAGVASAADQLQALGAKVVPLAVGGAFHSPLMQSARATFEQAVEATPFHAPSCPVYQNTTAAPTTDPDTLRREIIAQITAPVRWSQSIQQMLTDGVQHFTEAGGTGKVLQGMIKKIDRKVPTTTL